MIWMIRQVELVFQSTPPARGATIASGNIYQTQIISIHAPREGGDRSASAGSAAAGRFQSTPPARGATGVCCIHGGPSVFQSTPPARGATLATVFALAVSSISIHAPREGGDGRESPKVANTPGFQSTPPARGATGQRAGTDCHEAGFQSTPPARGATPCFTISKSPTLFQSTPPARGATKLSRLKELYLNISIHAPREGGDCRRPACPRSVCNFNPRPPRGGRQEL